MAPGTPTTPKQVKMFQKGDRVFAKVRGYPPWPARIEGIAQKSGTPKNMRYDVFFYGTYQTGKCTGDQLWSFEENRDKYGSPRNNKGFKEAMDDIIKNPKMAAPTNEASASEEEDESVEKTETTPSKPKSAKKRPASSTPKSATTQKKLKNPEPEPVETETFAEPAVKTGLTVAYRFNKSRKGKAAVKEASEPEGKVPEADAKEEEAEKSTPANSSSSEENTESPEKQENTAEPSQPIQPSSVKPKEGAVEVKLTRAQVMQLLGHQNLPDSLRAKLENQINATDNATKKYILQEVRLVETTKRVATIFKKNKLPELDGTMKVLNELASLPFEAIMLKKHPYIAEGLQQVVENFPDPTDKRVLKFSDEQKEKFFSDAKIIKQKVEEVLESYKKKCQIPQDKPFIPWLLEQSAVIQKMFPDRAEYISLQRDPTSSTDYEETMKSSVANILDNDASEVIEGSQNDNESKEEDSKNETESNDTTTVNETPSNDADAINNMSSNATNQEELVFSETDDKEN